MMEVRPYSVENGGEKWGKVVPMVDNLPSPTQTQVPPAAGRTTPTLGQECFSVVTLTP